MVSGMFVELRRVQLEPAGTVRAAHGDATRREVLVVRADDGGGHVGWGECAALARPGYTSEYLDGCRQVLLDVLIPAVLDAPGELHHRPGRGGRPPDGEGGVARRRSLTSTCGVGVGRWRPRSPTTARFDVPSPARR